MKASETRIDKFIASNETTFSIPVYQRNYDWSKVQCEQLLDDILRVGGSEEQHAHFVGSIVYVHDDVYSATGITELTIIDGQQRLTTLTLLYAAIYRFARSRNNEQLATRIYETYLINKFAQDAEKLKLKPTDENRHALAIILNSGDPSDQYGYSRLAENFKFFFSKLSDQNIDMVLQGISRLVFVDISLNRQTDNPQRIFESLNSTGLELSQADLIRNYILMGLTRKNQERIFKSYWEPVERNAFHHASHTSRLSDFIRDFLTLKHKDIPNKNAVYYKFKQKYLVQSAEMEPVLKEMLSLSKVYAKLLNSKLEDDAELQREINYVNRLEINVAYPFLMQVYKDHDEGQITRDQLISIMQLIQSYVWRRFIVGLPTNALNKIFMTLYDRVIPDDYVGSIEATLALRSGSARFPRDEEVAVVFKQKDMYNIKPKTRLYFFDKMENHGSREVVVIENSGITVEHIFPQSPDSSWRGSMTENEFADMKHKYLHTIGNLTLTPYNPSLSNKGFSEKKEMNSYGKEEGYKFSKLWLSRELQKTEGWGVHEVQTRAELLSQRFLKIWPDIKSTDSAPEEIEAEEVSIFEAEEPRNRSLDYALFSGERIEVKQVAKLYQLVLRKLFAAQPEAFLGTPVGLRLQLSADRESLRQPIDIDEGYAIEGNLDNNGKFQRLKFVLTELGMEDEFYIKFV